MENSDKMQIIPISSDFKKHISEVIKKAIKLYQKNVINENLEFKSNKKSAIDSILDNNNKLDKKPENPQVFTNISPVKLKASKPWIH